MKDPLSSPKKLPLRKKQKDAATRRFKFTKTKVAALVSPSKGNRYIYRDDHTPHLCLRVTPTSKTFYWEKAVTGAQKRVTIGKFPEINVEQARAQAAEIAADYVKGIDGQEIRAATRSEGTFGELWEDYQKGRKRRIDGKPSKALDYQWSRFFKQWENKRLSEITYARASRLIKNIRKKTPPYANRIQRHGKAMFNFARHSRDWQFRGENPFDFDFAPENAPRKIRLRSHEMPKFMEGLDAGTESMKLLFLASLYTGRRMGEVKSMRWVDLDLTAGIWNIPQTKVGAAQEAVLPTVLVEELVERQKESKSPWVFPSPSKSGHVEQIKKAWDIVRENSGLHELQARDLRRTLASWAQEVNVPIAAVQTQLGLASVSTTARHYSSISQAVMRTALDATVSEMLKAASTSTPPAEQ